MTVAAAIVADIRRAIALLAEFNDPAATRTAEALTRFLAGEPFDSAAGLPPGWRRCMQLAARDAALEALLALYPGMSAQALARRVTQGVARAARRHGVRPDGEFGLYDDLLRCDVRVSERHLRRLISAARAVATR